MTTPTGTRHEEQRSDQSGAARAPEWADASTERERLLSSTAQALNRLLGSEDFDPALADALRTVGEAARLHRVKVILPQPPRDGAPPAHDLVYEWWAPSLQSQARFGVTHFPDALVEGEYLVALRAGREVFHFIDEVVPALRPSFELTGMQSMGIVPIMIGSQYAGMVAFDDCVERRVFSRGEIDALAITGRAIGAAVYRREMQQREARHAADLSAANDALKAALARVEIHAAQLQLANDAIRATASRLSVEPSMDAFPGVLLCELARALGTGTATLTRHHPETDTHSVAAVIHAGELSPLDPMPARVASADFAAWARLSASTGPIVLDIERDRDLHWPGAVEYLRAQGCEAFVAVPIRSGATTIAQMSFAYPRVPAFNDVQRATIDVFCHQAALALHLTRLASSARSAAAERAVVEERNRMAGEIHDSLAQSFTSIALQSESLISDLDEHSSTRATLEVIEKTARIGLAEARCSVLALRPIGDGVGELENALEQLAHRCNIAGSVVCKFRTRSRPCVLGANIRDAMLRVAQEAVSNALRHSGASRLVIELDVEGGTARLSVTDDGVGMPERRLERAGGFGIGGMRTRAESLGGTLTVENPEDGRGTVVRMRVCV